MLATYTQVDNGLGFRLRYSEALLNRLVCYQAYMSGFGQQSRGDNVGGIISMITWG